jgi:hypothetical protein
MRPWLLVIPSLLACPSTPPPAPAQDIAAKDGVVWEAEDAAWDAVPSDAEARVPTDLASPEEAAPELAPLEVDAAPACPVAVLEVVQGTVVVPHTTLALVGSKSLAAGGVATYQWSVTQPAGSSSALEPSAEVADPSFEANLVGDYHFKLRVVDQAGKPSCQDAKTTVTVTPDQAIHVELLWGTAADLDLHLLHPDAGGPDVDGDGQPDGWFDPTYDCFWHNPSPAWGAKLVRADADGEGPELSSLGEPEDLASYTLGVHCRDDAGLGSSKATLRIYVLGVLTFQSEGVAIAKGDLWRVASVEWPSGKVKPITKGGQPHITANYPEPDLE